MSHDLVGNLIVASNSSVTAKQIHINTKHDAKIIEPCRNFATIRDIKHLH